MGFSVKFTADTNPELREMVLAFARGLVPEIEEARTTVSDSLAAMKAIVEQTNSTELVVEPALKRGPGRPKKAAEPAPAPTISSDGQVANVVEEVRPPQAFAATLGGVAGSSTGDILEPVKATIVQMKNAAINFGNFAAAAFPEIDGTTVRRAAVYHLWTVVNVAKSSEVTEDKYDAVIAEAKRLTALGEGDKVALAAAIKLDAATKKVAA